MIAIEPSVGHYLTADHAHLDALLGEARRLVAADQWEAGRATFVAFADGLAHHIDLEERILFPVFDARTGMRGPTAVMRKEHRAILEHVASARRALDDGDARRFAADTDQLVATLSAHNLKEERVIYPGTDAALADAERTALVAALRGA